MTAARTTTISVNSLLLVHGSGFKPVAEKLSDVSFAAMRAGVNRDYPDSLQRFDKLDLRLAYYGDLNGELLEESRHAYDPQVDIEDRRRALAELKAIEARKRFGIRPYDCLPGKTALPEFLANILSPLCGMLGLTTAMISRIRPDFAEYLAGKSNYASTVRKRVRDQLCDLLARGDRIMVVSHGTGSVVVYDVLWQLSRDERFVERYGERKVDTWVTLGAPLGDNSIRKYLKGAKVEPVSYPKNVVSWHNLSAEDDYVCHDDTLADDFKSMLEQRIISAVRDHRIYNLAVRYGKSNPHSSVGYYIHPRMSKIIVDWLKTPALETNPIYTL